MEGQTSLFSFSVTFQKTNNVKKGQNYKGTYFISPYSLLALLIDFIRKPVGLHQSFIQGKIQLTSCNTIYLSKGNIIPSSGFHV